MKKERIMSLKIKLVSLLTVMMLMIGVLLVGIFAAETQKITMQGSVNFEIADKSIYVQDVRMQEDNFGEPYSLKERGIFMPGYINGEFNMNLGTFTNAYGSFALYFDIINTIDETTEETYAYTVEDPVDLENTKVSAVILDVNGSTIDKIPRGTIKPSAITTSTQVTASIKLTVTGNAGTNIDLSQITITINQYIPQTYTYFTFSDNGDGTATLTDFDESLTGGLTDIVIPSSVSYDQENGIWMDGDLKVTAITSGTPYSGGVFFGSDITSVVLPSTLENIGSNAFYNCSGLTSITLPSSLTSIGDMAFAGCSGLTGALDLSNCTSLTSIGIYAFNNCRGLTSITLPSNLTSIGDSAFYSCSKLTSITLPSNLTSIGEKTFYNCSKLTSITLPSNLTSIGEKTFYNCSKLTSITLPSSLTSIGLWAFGDCSGLTDIRIEATTPPILGYYAIPSNVTTIEVPSASVDAYKSARGWSSYADEIVGY